MLALIPARDLDHAIRIANDSEYGLTGSVYCANREHINRAKEECHVGNLYVNRKCTGALVGVHPFGGFNMSGTDSKAGGRDYLLAVHPGQVDLGKGRPTRPEMLAQTSAKKCGSELPLALP